MDKKKFREMWDNKIDKAIGDNDNSEGIFKIQPVPPQEFFELWLKEPLFPEQYRIIKQMFTPDYKNWNKEIREILLLWGEGGSKDFTVVHTLAYTAYWLCCLKDPQAYFQIGANTPLVIACMSINEEHAKDVFFKQFTICLRNVRNPATGRNFFEELGVDLREGKDIQLRKVKLPNHIEAFALDASKYSGEGKNILVAIFDEIAELRYDRAKERYENLRHTAFSRFPQFYKMVMISYPRDEYDFMMSHYNAVEEWEEFDKKAVFKSRKAPWDVRSMEGAHPDLIKKRIYKLKEDYTPEFRKNPIEARRRYECLFPETSISRFIKKFNIVLDRCIYFDRLSPFISDNQIYVTEQDLLHMDWQPWFKPGYSYEAYLLEQKLMKNPGDEQSRKGLERELERHANTQYFVHIDLSKGAYDMAGITVMHPYQCTPTRIGYYVDLAVQIRPAENEINFEDIRKFIFKLNDTGYEIRMCTLDGYQSEDFKQILTRRGIECEIISIDRTRKPYDTLKDLLYQGFINVYGYLPLLRELKELAIDPKTGKVDHPAESQQRNKEEGLRKGSKDISDSLAGAIWSAVLDESDVGPAVVDSTDVDPSPGDLLDKI